VEGGCIAQYSPTGHLLFVRGATLSAVPFDRSSGQITGTAVPIIEGVAVAPWIGGAHYAVGPDGTLILMSGSFARDRSSAVWVNRTGKSAPQRAWKAALQANRGSPDGSRALFDSPSPEGDDEVSVADLVRGTAIKLSDDPRDDFDATWTADGRTVIWAALQPARLPFMVMRPIDGTGSGEPLLLEPKVVAGTGPDAPSADSLAAHFPGSVSRNGVLAYTRASAAGASDIWTLSLEGNRKPQPFVASPAIEFGPEFSPDGKWIAYVSNESGTREIYVVRYPGPGARRRVTNGGGVSAAWSRDGRELFYQTSEGLMVVDVGTDPALAFGTPRLLLPGNFMIDSREDGARAYDVSPDGRRFLMLVAQRSATPPPTINVLIDWIAELRKR
jgi:hypothetical protein